MLSLLLALPISARAEEDEEVAPGGDETRPKKKAKGDGTEAEGGMRFEDVELTPKKKKKAAEKAEVEKADDEKTEKPDEKAEDSVRSQILTILDDDKPLSGFARHRYGYIIGAGFLVTGLAFAYSSQGEAKRAETIGTAREAAQALENARASAATANVAYGMAIAALAVTLLFEILPEPVAEKASLTFHF